MHAPARVAVTADIHVKTNRFPNTLKLNCVDSARSDGNTFIKLKGPPAAVCSAWTECLRIEKSAGHPLAFVDPEPASGQAQVLHHVHSFQVSCGSSCERLPALLYGEDN